MASIVDYFQQLIPLGLKAVIISGGGNPILYKDKTTGQGFNEQAKILSDMGLELGLITNGMKMKTYPGGRKSWLTVKPETLDLFKWIRISCSGWDHEEKEVYTPDVDASKTTLGYSYVLHDRFDEPLEPNHEKVSTEYDLRTPLAPGDGRATWGEDVLPWIETKIKEIVDKHHPRYFRLLPNCLEPDKISHRSNLLRAVASRIDPTIVFVQEKPPRQPHACYKFYPHPVLNSDGWVYPCDSVVLNRAADHKFGMPWRVCRMEDVAAFYAKPVHPVIPNDICPGCVFSGQVDLLAEIVENGLELPAPDFEPEHANFV
jgi:hypothetical protein